MAYTSKLPASWNDRPPPRNVDIDLSSPGLAVFELERLLFTGKAIISHADEVWPGVYIGDHKRQSCPEIYQGMKIVYKGVEAQDSCGFDMSVNFRAAADFISMALSRGGKVLVHCQVGVSRSATLVLAYLMLKQRLTLVEAICAVKENRGVTPNRGFLRQLIHLDWQLFGKHY
ncbi:dual specificity protein phosphatase 26-like isoform X2 [Entelurus aequoreus]|uniref:dual specificity protein phosphatase 26-like isoform X2 n=1 Tax=Entelurus aequoreus TaxID=161455 RepID=UPI002B1E76F5|nr:dual specificity protein phosphatase 26-like isoform X2 [Entelurus aequoreus]